MRKVIDARGWACPKPAIETKKALQTEGELTVIVDNQAARQNVSRLASKSGHKVLVEEKDDGIYLHIDRGLHEFEPPIEHIIEHKDGKIVLLIASNSIGSGSEELGEILMRAFMHTFFEIQPRPAIIIFMNNGVKLTVSGSSVLEDLQTLVREGVEILICGTCLNYFGLTDKVAVGEISNAYAIAEALMQAGKVIRL